MPKFNSTASTNTTVELFRPLQRNTLLRYGFSIDAHHFAMVGVCSSCSATLS